MAVFVLGKKGKPLMPCSEKRARLLLERGRAVVVNLYPFTIRLKDRIDVDIQPIKIKIDPGSRHTGIAIVREQTESTVVLNLFELNHRGFEISEKLTSRRAMRNRRRHCLRYRPARFNNRTKPQGWLAPSLQHRINAIINWIKKLIKLIPITGLSQELVKFDMQLIQNPEISGVEYQQETLKGYTIREYLLEKWHRQCAYCDNKNMPLQIEHIIPKSKGGSNAISNLTLACKSCNKKKGTLTVQTFLKNKPTKLKNILLLTKKPLKNASAVNSTRWALANQLKQFNLPLELSNGAVTKFNRSQQLIPKTHALDAVCVGNIGQIKNWNKPTLAIKCTGRGSYQRTRLNKYGFPRGYLMRNKSVKGFQTGDIVKAIVTQGKKIVEYIGRVAIRASGSFNITTNTQIIQGISYKYCQLLLRNNGYSYQFYSKVNI